MNKLCNTCSPGMWYPNRVDSLNEYLYKLLKRIDGIHSIDAMRKNIAYSLQYIEFQIKLQVEINTNDVILKQNRKMTIIAAMSVIEAILYYLLIFKKINKKTEWHDEAEIKIENIKEINGERFKIQNLLFKNIPEKNVRMDFDCMIRIASAKKILGNDVEIYKKLNYLKKLRNKVHIHAAHDFPDSDWNNFSAEDISLSKIMLRSFLLSSYFSPTAEEKRMFSFLE